MTKITDFINGAQENKKIALVLSSGAARGLAHIGVIKALQEKKTPINIIVGTSIGALIAACLAKNGSIVELEKMVLETDLKHLLKLADFNMALLLKGFVRGENVKEFLKRIISDIEFKDLAIPLAVVATDANTGEAVIIKEGSVIEAVRASISLPVVFTPVKLGDRFLIDGGIVNPVPVDVAKDMGAGFIIASNVIRNYRPHESKRKKQSELSEKSSSKKQSLFSKGLDKFIKDNAEKFNNFNEYLATLKNKLPSGLKAEDFSAPGMFDVLAQAIYTMEYEVAKTKLRDANLIIEPNLSNIALLEFYKGKEAIEEGYNTAKKSL